MSATAELHNKTASSILKVRALHKTYRRNSLWSRRTERVPALQGVDLKIPSGSRFAIAGESGSGKSTLALCIAQLERADSGEILFDDTPLTNLRPTELIPFHRKIQLIFQDSALALNPGMTTLQIIAEPLEIARVGDKAQRRALAAEAMHAVGLDADLGSRSPLQLSGGQRQRVAFARALMLQPQLLILDESLSGLDLIIQEQIIELLLSLQAARDLTYVLITHDLGLASSVATHVAIMDRGRIVENGETRQVFGSPEHPCTKSLLAAIPRLPRHLAAAGGQA